MRAPETLKTARLVLRRPTADDAEALFDGYTSDPEVTRYLSWPRPTAPAAWATGTGPYAVVDAEGAIVGSTGLEVEAPYRAATGYVLARHTWGRGYATEVATAMATLAAELHIGRLYALCHTANRASARVLAKAGFSFEGVLRRHIVFPNIDPMTAQDVECWARLCPP